MITDPKSWSVDGNPIPMAFSDSSMEQILSKSFKIQFNGYKTIKVNLIPAEILRTLFKLLRQQQKVHYSETGRNAERKKKTSLVKISYENFLRPQFCRYIFPHNLTVSLQYHYTNFSNFRGTQRQFSKNICSEDDLRFRIFGTFLVKFLTCDLS